ncbi:hypothetical protein FAUST_11145 [Fusarium austroamericanum]|uniref:CBS domain-containing protein n=1 Tax=Fusarium austroamericanum TaxID=282268 RepID=A0AAN5YZX9_FUSAU|nr:hypothetical protein FAUST_11145 [Fusarium austroamericanum]
MSGGILKFKGCDAPERERGSLYVSTFLLRLDRPANATGGGSIPYRGYQRALELYGNEKAFDLTRAQRLKLLECTNLEMNRSIARKAGYDPDEGRIQLAPFEHPVVEDDLTPIHTFEETMALARTAEHQLTMYDPNLHDLMTGSPISLHSTLLAGPPLLLSSDNMSHGALEHYENHKDNRPTTLRGMSGSRVATTDNFASTCVGGMEMAVVTELLERVVKGDLDNEWKETIMETLEYIGGSENMYAFLDVVYKQFPKKSTPNKGRGAVPFANSPSGGGGGGGSSNIPRPVLEPTPPTETGSSFSASRQKQSKRDEAIRKKLENDLSKKKHLTSRARHSRKAPPGTVLALKPSQALQIKPNTTVSEAAQLMAAKREDCVLVTDDDDRIAGIFTAKDLAFRVVGAGAKASAVTIAEIMTKNPLCARTDTSATDALDLMVRKGFRHLPVMDENQDISGVLDITKCFYDAMEKLERAYSSSRKLYDALEGVQSELGSTQPQQIIQYVEALRSKMSGPTLETVLNGVPPTTVSVRTSVREAAQLMKENRTTAVLVQDQGAITGIFTSKDVVLRVIAPGLDPANCSVVRVMTPHPDFAPMDMTLQAALRKMHDGHYLNLPVMNDGGEIVGMVDVLKLTYATLDQINAMSNNNDEGPAWNKFWLSLDAETESMMSGEGSQAQHTNLGSRLTSPDMVRDRLNDTVAPGDSASHVGMESPPRSILPDVLEHQLPEELPFPFKFKAPSGRVHRMKIVATDGIEAFVEAIASKLGAEADNIGGVPDVEDGKIVGSGFALSFLDDEGDSISITADHDLLEAVILARQAHHDKVDLFVHDPEKPPVSAADPRHPATPSVSTGAGLRERRKWWPEEEEEEDDDDSEDEHPARRRKSRAAHTHAHAHAHEEQIIAGVPNELILPGAIVTLAVAIVGVFTIARLTSR